MTAQIFTRTLAAATPSRWRAAASWFTSDPTSWATSTSWGGASIPTTSAGWASAAASAPVGWFQRWVERVEASSARRRRRRAESRLVFSYDSWIGCNDPPARSDLSTDSFFIVILPVSRFLPAADLREGGLQRPHDGVHGWLSVCVWPFPPPPCLLL